jgi:hypothetical protein
MYDTLGVWRALWLSPRWQVRKEYLVLSKDLRTVDTGGSAAHGGGSPMSRAVTEADMPSLRAANPHLSEAEMRRRWGEGQTCEAVWIGPSLAHYRWETDRRCYLPYLRKTFEPLRGDTFVTEAFTHRSFRGQGIHTQLTVWSLVRARDRGYRRSLTTVAWWNAPARRVVLHKVGREVVGTVGYWNFGIGTRHFATGDVRFGPAGQVYVANGADHAERGQGVRPASK